MTANLATFIDRYTMRHVRIYPHPVERVWDAITDSASISAWMGFPVTLELRLGGRCDWGPGGMYFRTEIIRLEPTALIEHGSPEDPYEDRGYMRFELSPHPDGCRLEFTQHFPRQFRHGAVEGDLGGDLPGGPDTPWRPGFVGGFHAAFDALANVLDNRDPNADSRPADELFGRLVDAWLEQKVAHGEIGSDHALRYAGELRGIACWNELNETYRRHIRDTIPAR
jgi:uncharacterized protein YndB with AHSA1/START domain